MRTLVFLTVLLSIIALASASILSATSHASEAASHAAQSAAHQAAETAHKAAAAAQTVYSTLSSSINNLLGSHTILGHHFGGKPSWDPELRLTTTDRISFRVVTLIACASLILSFLAPQLWNQYAQPLSRVLCSFFFISAGLSYFMRPAFFAELMPSFTPFSHSLVYMTGALQILFGSLLLAPPSWWGLRNLGAWGLCGLLLTMVPSNIYLAFFSGDKADWMGFSKTEAMSRLPVQFLLMAWVHQFTELSLLDTGKQITNAFQGHIAGRKKLSTKGQ